MKQSAVMKIYFTSKTLLNSINIGILKWISWYFVNLWQHIGNKGLKQWAAGHNIEGLGRMGRAVFELLTCQIKNIDGSKDFFILLWLGTNIKCKQSTEIIQWTHHRTIGSTKTATTSTRTATAFSNNSRFHNNKKY